LICLKSSVSTETHFYLTIAQLGIGKNSHLKITTLTEDLSHKCILIAEDQDTNYKLLQVLLRKQNPRLLWAKNGVEAVDICKNNDNIDLILMDIRMPKMNGFEATVEIRKFLPIIPIIAQTAYSHPEDRKEALMIGCNDFITKPIDKEILYKKINIYLGQ